MSLNPMEGERCVRLLKEIERKDVFKDEQEIYKLGFIPIWRQITKKMYKYFQ